MQRIKQYIAFLSLLILVAQMSYPQNRSYQKGKRSYECSNHLGNVIETVSDKPKCTSDGLIASVNSYSDYYPYGMQLVGRNESTPSYRYGFNGKENDNETKGTGNSQDFGARHHDPRIARFSGLDPKTKDYPQWAPYVFAGNNPVGFIDQNGENPENGNDENDASPEVGGNESAGNDNNGSGASGNDIIVPPISMYANRGNSGIRIDANALFNNTIGSTFSTVDRYTEHDLLDPVFTYGTNKPHRPWKLDEASRQISLSYQMKEDRFGNSYSAGLTWAHYKMEFHIDDEFKVHDGGGSTIVGVTAGYHKQLNGGVATEKLSLNFSIAAGPLFSDPALVQRTQSGADQTIIERSQRYKTVGWGLNVGFAPTLQLHNNIALQLRTTLVTTQYNLDVSSTPLVQGDKITNTTFGIGLGAGAVFTF